MTQVHDNLHSLGPLVGARKVVAPYASQEVVCLPFSSVSLRNPKICSFFAGLIRKVTPFVLSGIFLSLFSSPVKLLVNLLLYSGIRLKVSTSKGIYDIDSLPPPI